MLYPLLRRAAPLALALATAAGSAAAAVVTFSGNLGDTAHSALVASDLTAPRFNDDLDKANNVALHVLHVPVAGSVVFASTGYAAGGVDPYFSLFSGSNRATATFVESNYLIAFAGGGDFTLPLALAAGDYTLAIGAFANLSFAENYLSGFLADGFTGLGVPGLLGGGSYLLTVTLPDATTMPVPEPNGAALALTAACAALLVARPASRRRKTQTPEGGR